MSALTFAARSLIRQPARGLLGVAGIAAIGALLFDMLLLSRGLVVSMQDLLEGVGLDLRVMATESTSLSGPRIGNLRATVATLTALPEVEEVVPLRFGDARLDPGDGRRRPRIDLIGANVGATRPWTLVRGNDLPAAPSTGGTPDLIINRNIADELQLSPGSPATIVGNCSEMAMPPILFRVVGVAEFPFDHASQLTAATSLPEFARACGETDRDEADMLMVASRREYGPDEAAEAIRRARPDLHPFTNDELVARFQELEFSYFRQISFVLASITFFFGFLLITVLLSVSLNQRLGEIAALRALGFSQSRVIADVMWNSALLVGTGGLLALPLGWVLSTWLDAILRRMPGLPAQLHFFVFEPRALILHVACLLLTILLAALYPMRIVSRLPIAATLRNEAL